MAKMSFKNLKHQLFHKNSHLRRQYQKNRPRIIFAVFAVTVAVCILISSLLQAKKIPNAVLRSEWSAPISKAEYDQKVIEFFKVANINQTKPNDNPKNTVVAKPQPFSQTINVKRTTEWLKDKNPQVVSLVKSLWKEEAGVALAVFQAESGLRPEAQGWNCCYDKTTGVLAKCNPPKTVSKACKVADRPFAWSVDCGVAQLNFSGNVCPKEAFNPEWNLNEAMKKHQSRGWQPWYAFSGGNYKKYL